MKTCLLRLLCLLTLVLAASGLVTPSLAASGAAGRAAETAMFATATSLYEQRDFASSLETFRKIPDAATRADLAYNIGTCCLQLGQIGEAVLWLMRANALQPGATHIARNLSLAQERAIDRLPPAGGTRVYLQSMFDRLPYPRLTFVIDVLILLCALIAGLRALLPRRSTESGSASPLRAALRPVLLLLLAALLLSLTAYGIKSAFFSPAMAVIIADEASVRSGPSTSFEEIFQLHAGAPVVVLSETKGFHLIDFYGRSGYIRAGQLSSL